MAKNTNENPQFIVSPRGNPRAAIREDVASVQTNLTSPDAWGSDPADPPGFE